MHSQNNSAEKVNNSRIIMDILEYFVERISPTKTTEVLFPISENYSHNYTPLVISLSQ